jgi:hypothetical protein
MGRGFKGTNEINVRPGQIGDRTYLQRNNSAAALTGSGCERDMVAEVGEAPDGDASIVPRSDGRSDEGHGAATAMIAFFAPRRAMMR